MKQLSYFKLHPFEKLSTCEQGISCTVALFLIEEVPDLGYSRPTETTNPPVYNELIRTTCINMDKSQKKIVEQKKKVQSGYHGYKT